MRLNEFGDLQLAVMNALWSLKIGSVHDVLAALPAERSCAYTTVLTVLRNLEKRGLVTHEAANGSRMFLYRPLIDIDEIRLQIIRDLLERLFEGSPALLIKTVLSSYDLTPTQRRELTILLKNP